MNTISFRYNLEQLKQRNKAAFTKLFRDYKDKIYSYLLLKSNGDVNIAEEVLCDTFHSIFKSAPKLKNTINIKNWIFLIASRRLNDYFRKLYKERNIFEKSYIEPDTLPIKLSLLDNIISNQKMHIIHQNINKLRDSYKTIIKLKYIENKSLKEISVMLNKNITVINNLLYRARIALKKEIIKTSMHFE